LELDATGSVEHKFTLSDSSSFAIQGGILDNLSGDPPPSLYERYPSWVNTLASRHTPHDFRDPISSWARASRSVPEDITGRQLWDTAVGGRLAGTMDLKLPLGRLFEFTSQIYRGRAVEHWRGLGKCSLEWISV